MKKITVLLILFFANISVCQQSTDKSNTILNPEEEAILQTKQLSLRLDLTKIQEEKIIDFLKLHLIEGQKIRQKRKKGILKKNSFDLKVQFLDHQKLLQEQFKLILDKNQYIEWKALQKFRKENMRKKRAKIKN